MGEKIERGLKVSEIISRKINGNITTEEEAFLQEWINESPGNLNIYNSFFDKKELVRRQKELNKIDINKAWNTVIRNINSQSNKKRIRILQSISKYAAIIILAISISLGIILISNNIKPDTEKRFVNRTDSIMPGSSQAFLHVSDGNVIALDEKDTLIIENGIRIQNSQKRLSFASEGIKDNPKKEKKVINYRLETPVGGEYQVVLSDGSRVWLNAVSELSYPSDFIGDNRVVKLKGEAYFEIQPNEKKAFIVITNKMDVKVTGTAFNVSAYEDDKDTHTTLVEGTVDVNVKRENGNIQEYRMNPGMQVLVDEKNPLGECNYVDVSKYTAWRNGVFIFEDDPLDEILKKISRWYNVDFVFNDPGLKDISFTADIKRFESFSTLLDLISLGSDVRFDVFDDKTIYVTNSKNKKR